MKYLRFCVVVMALIATNSPASVYDEYDFQAIQDLLNGLEKGAVSFKFAQSPETPTRVSEEVVCLLSNAQAVAEKFKYSPLFRKKVKNVVFRFGRDAGEPRASNEPDLALQRLVPKLEKADPNQSQAKNLVITTVNNFQSGECEIKVQLSHPTIIRPESVSDGTLKQIQRAPADRLLVPTAQPAQR